jgi:UDP-2,3-diacylglucosamine pyrophosphatase LpxH
VSFPDAESRPSAHLSALGEFFHIWQIRRCEMGNCWRLIFVTEKKKKKKDGEQELLELIQQNVHSPYPVGNGVSHSRPSHSRTSARFSSHTLAPPSSDPLSSSDGLHPAPAAGDR